ncbi:MAG: hypothetical protein ACREJ1_09355 [Candidatus Methylomirabilales bacterium]
MSVSDIDDSRSPEQNVRQRLLDIFQREGKVTERDLLRISAMTGVDYFTVSKTLEEILLHRAEGQDSQEE